MNQMVENQIGLYSEVFPNQEKNIFHLKLIFRKFLQILIEATQGDNCSHIASHLFMTWYYSEKGTGLILEFVNYTDFLAVYFH